MGIEVSTWSELDAEEREELLRRPALSGSTELLAGVRDIISAVRDKGDEALLDFCHRFDRVKLSGLRVSSEEFENAHAQLDARAVAAIELAIGNVRCFHEPQLPATIAVETMPGVSCKRINQPLDSVGLYVPAGTAPLPSAAIMLAVPAAIAGCPTRILCTPPRPDGTADPSVLVAAQRAGISDVFKAGGAQAIAAMAYGTESIPRVLKIFGPGNAWVTAAKTLVSSDPDGAAIDLPAGPSEVLVIADDQASPEFVAADLLSQAEHGPDSQVLLVTSSAAFAARVQDNIDEQLPALSRASIAAESLNHSHIIVTASIDTAIAVSNEYAPEHLILQVENDQDVLAKVRNAGSVFVGRWAPESVGDYCSGTNHVLPTYGYARSYSGLGVDQFMRQMTIQELTREGLESLADTVVTLAELEGLDAHAAAVTRRLDAST